jgi:hypothetical protein
MAAQHMCGCAHVDGVQLWRQMLQCGSVHNSVLVAGHLLNECEVRLPEINTGAAEQAAAEDGFDLLCVAGRHLHFGIFLPMPRLDTRGYLTGI